MAKKKTVITIDKQELMLNRAGKADGYLPEVRRGTGVHIPKKHKEKNKNAWKREVRNAY